MHDRRQGYSGTIPADRGDGNPPDQGHANLLFRRGSRMFLFLITVTLLLPVATPVPDTPAVTWSFVHLSDLQSLTTNHPGTLERTFARIESLKEPYNISAIIITGDVVNTWNSEREWGAYRKARNLTTLPVYQVAGNHDTDSGDQDRFYTAATGMPGTAWVSPFLDFDLVGINYARASLPPEEFARLRQSVAGSSRSHALIATHYYMDEDGTLSPLGEDIDTWLIEKPSIVLMGHMHANFIRARTVGGMPVVAGMTNYQDGVPGGTTGLDYSAGTLYTVTTAGGQVERITARVVRFFPEPVAEDEVTVYVPGQDRLMAPGSVLLSVTPSCAPDRLICRIDGIIRQVRSGLRHIF